jgi:hypothetical protein
MMRLPGTTGASREINHMDFEQRTKEFK